MLEALYAFMVQAIFFIVMFFEKHSISIEMS